MPQLPPSLRSTLLPLVFLLSACSSNIPLEIRQAPENGPSLPQVQNQPEKHISQNIRWGGRILTTVNAEQSSRLTIVAFPLSDEGKPLVDKQSSGRFIATIDHFLEPLEYKVDSLITITGPVTQTEIQDIGEYPYIYPVIDITHAYLWPEKVAQNYSRHPSYWHYNYNPWFHRRYIRQAPAISEITGN